MFTFLIPFYSFYQPYQSNISTAVSGPDFGGSQVSKARGLIVVVSTLGDGCLEGGSLVQAATLILKIISAKFISFEWIFTCNSALIFKPLFPDDYHLILEFSWWCVSYCFTIPGTFPTCRLTLFYGVRRMITW
ncbi:unnamed protein product [Linum tenue]|uniref:Uncharacterized protein n=1 Tax=Linum tenue TaxID=586396 RepID=A0AAV0ISA1_9ROSI|nr:unnamed protein product [Linum tenue]